MKAIKKVTSLALTGVLALGSLGAAPAMALADESDEVTVEVDNSPSLVAQARSLNGEQWARRLSYYGLLRNDGRVSTTPNRIYVPVINGRSIYDVSDLDEAAQLALLSYLGGYSDRDLWNYGLRYRNYDPDYGYWYNGRWHRYYDDDWRWDDYDEWYDWYYGKEKKKATETVDTYRLFNPATGAHAYTTSTTTRDNLVGQGWTNENVGWKAAKSSDTPVWQLHKGDKYMYTKSDSERSALVGAGWTDEGTAFYSDDDKSVSVYRLFNPANGDHFFTKSASERDSLVKDGGWKDEGTGFYAVS